MALTAGPHTQKTKEFAGQTPDAVQWLTNKPEKEQRFAEIVIRVQAGDDLWSELMLFFVLCLVSHAGSVALFLGLSI